jgi:thymidylate synthase
MDMVYSMRSCDMIRFYRDDIYMAGRLLQWVCQQLGGLEPDKLTVHIDNLHTFEGDRMFLSNVMTQYEELYGAVWGAAV